MLEFLKGLLSRPIKRLGVAVLNRLESWAEADLPGFATQPKNLTIALPRRISVPSRMYIGDDVYIGPGSLLSARLRYPTPPMLPAGMPAAFRQTFDPKITIGNRVTSTGGLILGAHQEITIEDDVMFAFNVIVSDALHGYETAETPYKYQPMTRVAAIVIKRGCWIGQNVVILPGVTIGELSIIGANSVVTNDVPARSIAVGAPARVIKQWDEAAQRWSGVA